MKKRNAITRKEHTSESAPILSRIRWRTLNRRVTQEQKNRELYTPTISLFRWWARRPHSLIGSILDAAAETIGRIPCISDPFSGGGTVAMEAACREFPVYAQDLYPWPNFSLHTSLSHTSIEEFDSASKHLLSELDHLRDAYRREDERELTHVLRVRVGRCPGCYEPVHLFPNPMLSLASRSSMEKNAFWGCRACGHLTTKRWNLVRFVCPNCNWRHDLKRKSKRFFFCPHCNYKGLPTNFLAGSIVWQAVLVQEGVLNKRRYRALVRTVEEGDPVSFSLASKSHNVLRTPIPDGVETRRLLTMGFRYWGDLYTARQAQVLIEALSIIKDMKVSSSCADRLALAVIGASEMAGLLCRWDRFHLKVHEGVANHRYAHTTLAAETNLLGPMGRGTLQRRLQVARDALVWKQENVNLASLHNSGEFNGYKLGEEKPSINHPVTDEYARKIRHAYFASISYIDAQVGKLLDELEKEGLAENTIIVIWGDHGWHLGDQRMWGKHTIFERALKSAFIIKAPNNISSGKTVDKVVRTIDMYPTLMELCGVKTPFETDGKSLVSIMKKPDLQHWENASYGYFRNGISLRTNRYRLTRYFRKQEPVIELYDHQTDPYESRNIALENPEIVEQLMPLLEKGNTGLYNGR